MMRSPGTERRSVLVFDDMHALAAHFSERFRAAAQRAFRRGSLCAVALPGGRTPIPLYDELAAAPQALPWEGTAVWWGDEKWVPPADPRSNYRAAGEHLLRRVPVLPSNVHPVRFRETVRASALGYEEELRRAFRLRRGEVPRFDLILLGIGEDGHIASLFPGSGPAHEHRHLVAYDEGRDPPRVTLTLPAINGARNVFFLATGYRKAAVLKEVLEKNRYRLPASLVSPGEAEAVFLLDRPAASLLETGG